MKLTKTVVAAMPASPARPTFYRDTLLAGFGLRVSGVTKTYFVEKRVAGRTVRVSLGRHGQMTCEQARRSAQAELGRMSVGVNPSNERRAARARGVTLSQAFAAFLEARNSLKPSTVRSYRQVMLVALGDWQDRPVVELGKDMVSARHAKLGAERGRAYANLTMRVLRAVLNFAANQYEDSQGRSILPDNPVVRLSRTKAWFKVSRRQTVILPSQLAAWFQAVNALGMGAGSAKGTNVRDYLLLVLFTGLRREEAARLRWQDVDLVARTLTIPDTKNGEALTIPLSDFVAALLEQRRAVGVVGYVFPGEGAAGHLVEPKKQIEKVRKSSGVNFTIHDLRRTFITAAESLDISAYAVKRLVNHKFSGDVTAGYVVHSIDRLRDPMERISGYFVAAFALDTAGGIVQCK